MQTGNGNAGTVSRSSTEGNSKNTRNSHTRRNIENETDDFGSPEVVGPRVQNIESSDWQPHHTRIGERLNAVARLDSSRPTRRLLVMPCRISLGNAPLVGYFGRIAIPPAVATPFFNFYLPQILFHSEFIPKLRDFWYKRIGCILMTIWR